jgi:predicted amidohydrolase YtcJ
MSRLLITEVDLDGEACDVVCDGGIVNALFSARTAPTGGAAHRIDAGGGAVLPGIHDHHIHLLATAAAATSIDLTRVRDRTDVMQALSSAPGAGWVRAVGYDEHRHGRLDRWILDGTLSDRPVRVQHRTGAMWILNSAGCQEVGLDVDPPPGAGRDESGRLDGTLWREDRWLGDRLPPSRPDLRAIADRLLAAGVIGVTDATPVEMVRDWDPLVPIGHELRIHVTGSPALTGVDPPHPLRRGPVKIVLDESELPELDTVASWIIDAHRAGRAVAMHIVTRATLVYAVAAWRMAGTVRGDRIEHGSVIPGELIDEIRRLGLTIVTQPSFVVERGDRYLATVDEDDLPHLYRCRSLLEAGIPVAGSSDAPYGPLDPWEAIHAAVHRRTRAGLPLGPEERIGVRRALDLYLGPAEHPGGPSRTVAPGQPADLVVLDAPLDEVLARPTARRVLHTIVGGHIVWSR